MKQSAILASAMRITQVVDASDWDSGPIRELLVWSLAGPPLVWGELREEFIAAERAGLVEFRLAKSGEIRLAKSRWVADAPWFATTTDAGHALALRLAHSWELLRLIDLYNTTPTWSGVAPRRILAELDLRDGGTGVVADWRHWGAYRAWDYVSQLPRRGLDGQVHAQYHGD